MVPLQSLQVSLEIILPSVLLQFTRTSTYVDGKGIISSTVKNKQNPQKPQFQSSSSEAVQKLVYFQPSISLICNV